MYNVSCSVNLEGRLTKGKLSEKEADIMEILIGGIISESNLSHITKEDFAIELTRKSEDSLECYIKIFSTKYEDELYRVFPREINFGDF